ALAPRDDRYAARHGLQRRHAELLGVRREDGQYRATVGIGEVVRGEVASEEDVWRRLCAQLSEHVGRAAADHMQREVRDLTPGVKESIEPFSGRQAPHADRVGP